MWANNKHRREYVNSQLHSSKNTELNQNKNI